MARYYPLRRVPQAYSSAYFWRRVGPLVAAGVGTSLWNAVVESIPRRSNARAALITSAQRRAEKVLQDSQRRFFDQPGLDTLAVREMTKIGRSIARTGRVYLWTRMAVGADRDGRARQAIRLIPRQGYDQLMLTGLAIGTALGYFRGGRVHSHLWWDSARGELGLPEGHPRPGLRRFQAPTSLGDTAADIDDLYWAEAHGQSIKISRIGEGKDRRWIVSIPGTDHPEWASQPNVADLESNFREELNLPSAMRIGLLHLINKAMHADGIGRDERSKERVLLVGHSQGGMVAVALAAMDPTKLGFTVDGVITLGSPARRIEVRRGVAVLAVENDQDIIPALDGTPRREADGRVVYRRRLVRPRHNPLFYAHSSSTYTETLRQAERRRLVAPWGRLGEVVSRLSLFLPKDGEPTRVFHGYAWQELLNPTRRSTWDQYFSIERPDWQPVSFGGEVEETLPHIPTPAYILAKTGNRHDPSDQ